MSLNHYNNKRHTTEKAGGVDSVGTSRKGHASHNTGKRVLRNSVADANGGTFLNPGSAAGTRQALMSQQSGGHV
jgi:hypothetical protein